MAAWRYEFYFLVAKTIFYSLTALIRKILFCHSKIKFIFSRHRVHSHIGTSDFFTLSYVLALLSDLYMFISLRAPPSRSFIPLAVI